MQKQFTTAKIIPYTETIGPRFVIEDLTEVSKVALEKECQAAITGMAA